MWDPATTGDTNYDDPAIVGGTSRLIFEIKVFSEQHRPRAKDVSLETSIAA
jgi:hypothetical protein